MASTPPASQNEASTSFDRLANLSFGYDKEIMPRPVNIIKVDVQLEFGAPFQLYADLELARMNRRIRLAGSPPLDVTSEEWYAYLRTLMVSRVLHVRDNRPQEVVGNPRAIVGYDDDIPSPSIWNTLMQCIGRVRLNRQGLVLWPELVEDPDFTVLARNEMRDVALRMDQVTEIFRMPRGYRREKDGRSDVMAMTLSGNAILSPLEDSQVVGATLAYIVSLVHTETVVSPRQFYGEVQQHELGVYDLVEHA